MFESSIALIVAIALKAVSGVVSLVENYKTEAAAVLSLVLVVIFASSSFERLLIAITIVIWFALGLKFGSAQPTVL